MSARGRLRRLAAGAPRAAAWLGAALIAYVLGTGVGLGWGLPEAALSPAGVALGIGLAAALLGASAASAADRAAAPLRRLSRALLPGGLALVLAGLPLSLLLREERSFQVGEGQEVGEETLPGLPSLAFGEVRIAPRGENPLLSKVVSIQARTAEGWSGEVGLWPPVRVGAWRLAVLRYGLAPGLEWRDEAGRPIAEGFVMLGTFPKTEEEARLVTWLPEPNVMLGVGYFPPRLEDLLSPPRSGRHLFLRLDEATLGGARRAVADPSAYRWLADGRPNDPIWFAQVFAGGRPLWSGRLRPGERATFAGGSLRLSPEMLLWVEIQAVRDPWIWLAVAGAAALSLGAVAALLGRRAGSRPPGPA